MTTAIGSIAILIGAMMAFGAVSERRPHAGGHEHPVTVAAGTVFAFVVIAAGAHVLGWWA